MKKSKKLFSMNDDYMIADEPETIIEEPIIDDKSSDLSIQMDLVVRGLSGIQSGGQVYLVDVRQLEPYPNQPFHQYPLERLQELADDIIRVGILSPILTRSYKNKLQILAGHNRWSAAKLAGLTQVPVMILDADDDQAALILTSTNLRQREKLLPGEKAFAYKIQMEALKRQGQRTDGGYNASSYITQQTGDSRMQIHRYIRLTELLPELLELLDKGKISLTPAVAVSYLTPDDQQEVLRCINNMGVKLTIEKGNRLRDMAAIHGNSPIGAAQINTVMLPPGTHKKIPDVVSIRYEKIQKYLPEGLNADEIEEWLVGVLER